MKILGCLGCKSATVFPFLCYSIYCHVTIDLIVYLIDCWIVVDVLCYNFKKDRALKLFTFIRTSWNHYTQIVMCKKLCDCDRFSITWASILCVFCNISNAIFCVRAQYVVVCTIAKTCARHAHLRGNIVWVWF